MQKRPAENIGHSSLTDHRILRTPSEIPLALQSGTPAPPVDLIHGTRAPDSGETLANLRNLALAYAQVAGHYPEFSEKSLATLEQAAARIPNDAGIQASYGLFLRVARPREEQRAAQALQKAIDLGSKSAEVRTQLARLQLRKGEVTAAIELFKESIQAEPFYTPAYLDLAQIYATLKDRKSAVEVLESVLKVDPGNDAARQELLKVGALPEENK
jgi:Tfp pilus assembly protein PilF